MDKDHKCVLGVLKVEQAFDTLGEVMNRIPASAASSMRLKFEMGLDGATESLVTLVGFGAAGTDSAGMDSTIALPNTGGPAATGFGGGAGLPISRLTFRLNDPT